MGYVTRSLSADAAAGCVAFGAACMRRVQEEQRVLFEIFERNADNVPGACKPCLRMSDAPFRLQATLPQPCVGQGEARAAMVVLAVVDPHRCPSCKIVQCLGTR